MEKLKKNYDILDLGKFISSLFIVAIHSVLFPEILYPWLRIAVPLFFVISSFLLFRKINLSPKNEKWTIIKRYIIRLLKYYLFWFVICLPATMMIRADWFAYGVKIGVLTAVRETLFSSTFVASWFIVSLIWGVLIIGLVANKKTNIIILFVTFAIYIICTLWSSYSFVFQDNSLLMSLISRYKIFFSDPLYSFPVGLFWIMLGKLFAEDSVNLKNRLMYLIIILISAILLYVEWRFVFLLSDSYNNDVYLFLAPLTFAIFGWMINTKIDLKYAKKLRILSNVTYPLHASVAYYLILYLKVYFTSSSVLGLIVFVLTLIGCYVVCLTIVKLQKYKFFSFLKVAF